MSRPTTVVFDVNETLTDMRPLADRFEQVGAPGWMAQLWFASLLRDAFALTAAGATAPFATLAEGALRSVLAKVTPDREIDAAVRHVLAALSALSLHPDVVEGVTALRDRGLRLTTLTNGSAAMTELLLTTAGLREKFAAVLSVQDAGVWKPSPAAYLYAASRCAVDPAEMVLVAVHPWDVDGAMRAGLAGAWLNRTGEPYPAYFTAPTWQAQDLRELADLIAP